MSDQRQLSTWELGVNLSGNAGLEGAMFRFTVVVMLIISVDTGCSSSSHVEYVAEDGIDDSLDNCPLDANPDQADQNSDGIGDACEPCDSVTMLGEGFTADPNQFTVLNDVLYFYAGDELHGDELFAYDPALGAYLVTDINPGLADGSPAYFATVGNKLFMGATTPEYGDELMVFDSTQPELGVTLVADLYPGPDSGYPSHLVTVQDRLYLLADDGIHGRELWVHDYVSGQTQLLDINVNNEPRASQPTIMNAFEDKLYFSADDGIHGQELWVHSPATGALMVADINANGSGLLTPQESLIESDGKLYFSGFGGAGPEELWVYDSASGASVVPGIDNEPYAGYIRELTELDGQFYFWALREIEDWALWQYSPVSEETRLVYDAPDELEEELRYLTALNHKLYFSEARHEFGRELWVLDPSAQRADSATLNATLVADINPGVPASRPHELLAWGGKLYFTATNADSGTELWVYDPQNPLAAALMVADIWPGPDSSSPREFQVMDGKLYFRANTGGAKAELWVHDPACGTISSMAEMYKY